MRKRIVCIFLSLTLLVGVLSGTAFATSKTADEAIAWVKSKVGKSIDFDGKLGEQCVDLILAYYNYLGEPLGKGDARDYMTCKLPDGWKRVKGGVPQKGDIIIYDYGNFGHVAIFESKYSTYHQNFNQHNYVDHVTLVYNWEGSNYWGCIRPNFAAKINLAAPVVTTSSVASSGKIKLSWDKVSKADKYYIYRSTDGKTYKYYAGTTKLSYTDSKAVAGKKYYYKVKSVMVGEAKNVYSAYSKAHSRTCDLARPAVLIALSGKGAPKLTWDSVDGAVSYVVYRSTSKSGTYSKLYTTSKTSFTNTSAKAGKTYYYKVKATCKVSAAASAYSSVVSIKAK